MPRTHLTKYQAHPVILPEGRHQFRDGLGLNVETVCDYEIGRRCVFALNDLRAWVGQNDRDSSIWSLLETWLKSDSTPFHWNDPVPAMTYLARTVAGFFSAERLSETRMEKLEPNENPRYEKTDVSPDPLVQGTTVGD